MAESNIPVPPFAQHRSVGLRATLRSGIRDLAASTLYAARLTRPAAGLAQRLSIVTFHRVLPEDLRRHYPLPGLVVTPDELDWFLTYFRESFEVLPLARAVAAWSERAVARPILAITFDDGQQDNFVWARPVLQRHGLRASFFAPSAAIASGDALWHDRAGYAIQAGFARAEPEVTALFSELSGPLAPSVLEAIERLKGLPAQARGEWLARLERATGVPPRPEWDAMMSFAQLRELAQEGHEIGSHSVSHELMTGLSEPSMLREARESKETLERAVGAPIESFCYPNGTFDARVVAAVESAGYRQAVTTRWGSNAPAASRFELRRFDCVADNSRDSHGRLSAARLAWRMSRLHPGPTQA